MITICVALEAELPDFKMANYKVIYTGVGKVQPQQHWQNIFVSLHFTSQQRFGTMEQQVDSIPKLQD